MADALAGETQRLYGLPLAKFTAARNELVREDPSEVRALIQSGKRLRQAQESAVSSKKGADLTAAVQEHCTGLERVQRELRARKLSGATLEKATQTLRVASVDPDLQPLLDRKAEQKRQRAAEQRLREAETALGEAEARARAAHRDLERAAAAVERARRAV